MTKTMIYVKVVLLSLFLALLFISVFGSMSFHLKALEWRISLQVLDHGLTEFRLPPVGTISAKTHLSPLKISLELLNIDLDSLQQLLSARVGSKQLWTELRSEAIRIGILYILRLSILAILGGIIGAILITGKQVKPALLGTVASLLLCFTLLGLTYATYDKEKFRSPEFQGALKAAPWAVNMVETALHKFNLLGEQMKIMAANLNSLYERINEVSPVLEKEDDLLVLHVSDMHNNPVAHQFLQQIVTSFSVDMVIDTGDITDFGTPVEGLLLKGLMDFKIPYVFIPGNHDSPDIVKQLSRYPQVQVLTGGIVDVQGLRILAMADPSSTSRKIAPSDNEVVERYRAKLLQLWNEAVKKPHLIAVHNFNITEPLLGQTPLILFGHTHQYSISQEKGTVLINAGTTGAAGLRGLQATKEIPYSVVLLHFRRNSQNEPELVAADTIRVYNLERGFTLERKLFKTSGVNTGKI
ncbi:hypothetical protein BR63_04820 [Thermanaerosceptrum fracticalcis]|uniref:Calcineurin-like phosphoesterase domain-containing protein n=1 Tax=Thermanaerosceptrum fracticalcis TaxID=1712410 RepID=A0A7G6E0T6_THEFR|nr:metallophosphoesterase [Thermanaerosceptrum fracticalcis]QNB45690.1 hypothetical protein BR63_04820 [Thermanaerosceptrum fracticalcis]